MYILGIHDNHDASAALMKDGEIIAAAQEERFTGLKGDYGYPKKAVEFCLGFAGIASKDLDCVALSGKFVNPALTYIKRNVNFSVSDWVEEQEKFWKPLKFENKEIKYYDIFKDRNFKFDRYYDYSGILSGYMISRDMHEFLSRRIRYISKTLNIPKDKVLLTNHEANHKSYALFSSRFRREPILILTCEGMGDDYNATVSVYKDGNIKTLCEMKENALGNIYQYVTLILGMKPDQHEYKVMGLAPYSNEYEASKAYKIFKKILKVDGLEVKFDQKPKDLYFTLRDGLKDCRFDGIAGGLQLFLEETLCYWTANCINHTGIKKVVIGGGVAQNIKAVKSISELDGVSDIFVPPAAGDTSNSIGACYNAVYQFSIKDYSAQAAIKPLNNIYLGPSFKRNEIEDQIKNYGLANKFNIKKGITNTTLAQILKEGKIIALMRGRMEFGLRSLGNRSILADPSNPLTVDKINRKIKFRDFWMPFTPSMLDYRANDYIKNPKNLYSPFMTMAFDSREENRGVFPAAMHPADKTVRPQITERDKNPEYYALIEEFQKLTGNGVILNTSLNLHGKPVALGPKDAIDIFLNSKLDALIMEDYLIDRE